ANGHFGMNALRAGRGGFQARPYISSSDIYCNSQVELRLRELSETPGPAFANVAKQSVPGPCSPDGCQAAAWPPDCFVPR
ncbi:MAG: hypothetical protein LBJ47_08080, partial [Tannerella sp.]|nr:hypothetical protein [Tannerella sp.]